MQTQLKPQEIFYRIWEADPKMYIKMQMDKNT